MTDSLPQNLFDLHQHVGSLVGHIPGATRGEGSLTEDARSRLAFMDHAGIAQAALMPAHAYNAARGALDISVINDRLLTVQALAPDRFPVIAATVDPRHGSLALIEIDRLHAAGVQALSFHNRFQGLPMDHTMMFRIVECAANKGMVLLMHTYASGDFESPWRLRRLAEAFPETTFIALDTQTSKENIDQLIAIAEILPNILIDITASLLGVAGLRLCLARLGASRLVLGTNFYSFGKPRIPPDLLMLAEATKDPEIRQSVGGGNARRLFFLT